SLCMSCFLLLYPLCLSLATIPPSLLSTLFPYTTLFRSFLAFNAKIEAISTMEISDVASEEKEMKVFVSGSKLAAAASAFGALDRSEEHTSELQSRFDIVCRLLLEKKNLKQEVLV